MILNRKRIQDYESKLSRLEITETSLRRELEDLRLAHSRSVESSLAMEMQSEEINKKMKRLQTKHRELEMEHDAFRVRNLSNSLISIQY